VNRLKLVSAAAVLLLALTAGAGQVSGATTSGHGGSDACTEGDAQAALEAGWVPGLAETSFRCRFPLYLDGAEFTFCEGDVIAGSIRTSNDWSPNDGSSSFSSRAEATASLDEFHHRVWMDGVEQVLTASADKAIKFDESKWVVRSTGFIARLAVGDHVSVWEGTFSDFPPDQATITIHIEPAGSC
jgi:hypothetical protein